MIGLGARRRGRAKLGWKLIWENNRSHLRVERAPDPAWMLGVTHATREIITLLGGTTVVVSSQRAAGADG
jgi:hypothetical protein